MIETIYYQRGAADPILENGFVLDIVKQYVPGVKKVTDVDETGGEARTYAVDNNIILKVQRPQQLRNTTSLEREVFFLRQLENIDNVNVPTVLGYGKEDTVEYTVMTRMPGLAVRYSNISGEQREKMLFEVGKTLYLIHSVDIKPFLESGLFTDIDNDVNDVKSRLKTHFDRGLKSLSEKVSQVEIDKANNTAMRKLGKITAARIVPCHSNPSATHIFVKSNNRFSGIIDFGDAYISHGVFDIRRWALVDRKPIIDGYMSVNNTDDSFITVCEAANALDKILNELSNK